MACFSSKRGWREWLACVGGVPVWVGLVVCLRGWRG